MHYNWDMSTIEIRALRFDDWNRAHLAREHHEVSEEEARQVVVSLASLVWISYGDRPVFLGPTAKGRMLVVVLDPEGDGVYYPVSGRPASRKERALYARTRGTTESKDSADQGSPSATDGSSSTKGAGA